MLTGRATRREQPAVHLVPLSTKLGHVPRRVGHDGCPVGSRALSASTGTAGVVAARAFVGRIAMTEENFTWFAGDRLGLGATSGVSSRRTGPHCRGAGVSRMAARAGLTPCDWVLSMCGRPNTVAVAIEVPHGPVVDVLLDRGFVVYAINPKQLDRLRDRLSVAGAKDDRRDASCRGRRLRTDRPLFRRVHDRRPAASG